MRGWLRDLTDLVLPVDCAGCGSARTAVCEECLAALCASGGHRVRPDPEPPALPAVYAAAAYEDAVRALLLAHKERGALGLAGALGRALAGAVTAARRDRWRDVERGRWPDGPGDDSGAGPGRAPLLLVPVPSARGGVRARGHDPARRIAFAAAAELRRTGTPARVASVLRQRRAVADQVGLAAPARLANLRGALEVPFGGGGVLSQGPVVLVDDVMTTGASLVESARAVRAALAAGRADQSATCSDRTVCAAVVAAPPHSSGTCTE